MSKVRTSTRRGLAAGALIATVALTAGPAMATAAAETAQPSGPGCAQVPARGPGSVADMATQPVASAAARNPLLTTLATAVGKAGLVDTLNRAPAVTVFAPTNQAFAKIPPATLNKVLADKQTLTSILTYHVVPGRQAPADLQGGRFKTLQGDTLTTAKKGDGYTVNGARVVCGNVQTRNATVYLIDTALMPNR